MAEYRFSLTILLDVRSRKERSAQEELFQARLAYQEALHTLRQLRREEAAVIDEMHKILLARASAFELFQLEQYLGKVQLSIAQQYAHAKYLEAEMAVAHQAVIEAIRQRQQIENMVKEKRRAREEDLFDDLTTLLFKHFHEEL